MLFWRAVAYSILLSAQASAAQMQFQDWFGGFRSYFEERLHGTCQEDYEAFLTNPSCPACDVGFPASGNYRGATAVVNCLLNSTDEFVKANIAVGTVILGLLPTILSFSGSTTTEMGLLAQRRPLLATMLAMSSPSIYPIRALNYEDPAAAIRPGHTLFPFAAVLSTGRPWVSSVVQYLLTMAAAANVATQIWALCVKTVSVLDIKFMFWPLMWPLTALFIHLLGWAYVRSRVRLDPKVSSIKEKIGMEFTPSGAHEQYKPEIHDQTLLSGSIAWLASILTICHIIYGTAALSSLLFIGVVDAVYVALRMWASAVVVRAVVVYELSGMASSLNLEK